VTRSGQTSGQSQYFVETLARGLAVLAVFSEQNKALSLAEISRMTGLNKSSVFRLLATLEILGYVHQDEQTKKYQPTPRVLDLGCAALDGMALGRIALPHMHELSRKHQESVSLATLVDHEIVYLERIETTQLLNVTLAVGSHLPAYCTSMGKVLLAYQSRAELDRILQLIDLVPRGPNTALTVDALLQELELTRQRGYSINDQELAAGVRSTAAPIRTHTGEVIAAVNVAVPSARVSLEELRAVFAPDVVATAEVISADWAKVSPRSGQGLGPRVATVRP